MPQTLQPLQQAIFPDPSGPTDPSFLTRPFPDVVFCSERARPLGWVSLPKRIHPLVCYRLEEFGFGQPKFPDKGKPCESAGRKTTGP